MKIVLLFCAVTVFAITDREHMSKCLPAVRSFIAEGGDSVDWLFEKADNDADVVLLFMLRMCYFHQEREAVPQYDAKRLFGRITGKVESFTDYEFGLLSETIKDEVVSGKPYEELFNQLAAETSESIFQHPALMGLLVTGAIIAVLIRQRRRTKQD